LCTIRSMDQMSGDIPATASQPGAPEIWSEYVGTRWGQVNVRHAGRSGPALMLFHESPLSSEVFSQSLPHLGRRLRVSAFDTPGYGASDPPPEPAGIAEYAETLLEAIDQTHAGPFVALGSHTGASIALEVAMAAGPSRIVALVLCGVPLLSSDERRLLEAKYAPPLSLQADGGHLTWAWQQYLESEGGLGPGPPLDLINLAAVHVASNHRRFAWGYRAAFAYDPEPALRRLECPVLLLNTPKDVLAHCDEPARRLVADGRIIHMNEVKNRAYWHLPELFSSHVTSFVEGAADGAVARDSE